MLHPGIPSLTHPIKQKKGLHWFMAAIFGTTLFCYMTLGIVVSLWFRGDINETASLNWPHVDTEMEVLKDGEKEGAELMEGNDDELGRGKAGKKGRSPPMAKAKSFLFDSWEELHL
ncbi:hypothetical protein EMCRGX_G009581 [Ephydatia muelleri]